MLAHVSGHRAAPVGAARCACNEASQPACPGAPASQPLTDWSIQHMPTTTVDTPQGPTLEEAAYRMESLLDFREGNTPDASDKAAEAPAEGDEGVAEAEAQETTADEAEGAKDKAADAEETTEATDAEEPQMVTIKVDGKTETVPLEEALQGYQRHRDYSRKTAELANQRRELEEQGKAAKEERQTYAT